MSVTTDHRQAELDVGSLCARAHQIAGGGELQFLEGLRQLTSALEAEAKLTETGRRSARAALVRSLVTQLQTRRMLQELPELAKTPIRPIVVTGLLRSGTTFLQELLSHHPDLRSPQLWELMAPASPQDPARLVAEAESYVEEYYAAAPAFRSIHPLGAHKPEECHRLTANSFRHFIYALRYHVPSYVKWLREQDMVEAYQWHRAQLTCLLARHPGNPVLLKCPSHLWHTGALRQVYPEAKVIRLHRRPSVSIPSVASLTAVVRIARSASVDTAEIGSYWLKEAGTALHGLHRDQGCLDLRFGDVVADPMRAAQRVCDFAGLPMTEQATARMTAFLAGQGAKPGKHDYRAEEFGLSTRQLDEHFAQYQAEFGLDDPREESR